jgi:hypothetical protein
MQLYGLSVVDTDVRSLFSINISLFPPILMYIFPLADGVKFGADVRAAPFMMQYLIVLSDTPSMNRIVDISLAAVDVLVF